MRAGYQIQGGRHWNPMIPARTSLVKIQVGRAPAMLRDAGSWRAFGGGARDYGTGSATQFYGIGRVRRLAIDDCARE